MMIRTARKLRRSGAAAVETAIIMIPLTMFIFGVLEYGRLLMDWNLLNNAARDGCRYALANNTSSTVTSTVTTMVTTDMAGETKNFTSGLTVTVTGTHQGTSTAVNNLQAGDTITVTVSGTFQFMNVIPLIKMTNFPMSSSVTMICEGAT